MSEYRFTGPFYNDNEDHEYGNAAAEAAEETVTEETVTEEAAAEETVTEETAAAESVEPEPPKAEKAKKNSFGKKLARTACAALVAGAVGGGAFLGVVHFGGDALGIGRSTAIPTVLQKDSGTASLATTVKDSIDVTDIVKKCKPSVVSITSKGVEEVRSWFGTFQQPTSGSGSGIIIGQNDTELLVATNYHVVAGSTELSVCFSYDEQSEKPNVVSAKIKGYDSQKDLAVIAVALSDIPAEARDQIAVATIGDSSQLEVGEQVVAIGNALGYGQSTTTGIVSALDREVSVQGTNGEVITNKLIQTDAAINPGNSGGALINMKGEVIGINSVKLVDQKVEGFGYAIPITDVESIIGDLMNKEIRDKVDEGKEGYLGVNIVDVTSDIAQTFNLPLGVYVTGVVEGGAAEKAGIQEGDVIVKLDGSSVASMAELKEALSYYKAGETIDLVVKTRSSNYQEETLSVTLSSAAEAGIE